MRVTRIGGLLAFGAMLSANGAARADDAEADQSSAPPVLEVLEVKDARTQGRAAAVEIQTMTGYIAAKMAASGAYTIRPSAASRPALAAARKKLLADCPPAECPPVRDVADYVMETTIGPLGSGAGCAITANVFDLRSMTALVAAAEQFECTAPIQGAVDQVLAQLLQTADDDEVEPWPGACRREAPPEMRADRAEVTRMLERLAREDPDAAARVRSDFIDSPFFLVGLPREVRRSMAARTSSVGWVPDEQPALEWLWKRTRAALGEEPPAPPPCSCRGFAGSVTVNTIPASEIYLGDLKLGETPLANQKLPAGCVELRAVSATGKEKRVNVEVQPNKNLRYQFAVE